MVKNNSTTLSSIESMLNSLQNGGSSFIFTTLLVYTTTSAISTKSPLLQSTFTSLFHAYLLAKSSLRFPTNIPFLYTSAVFHLPIFCVQPSQQSTSTIFSLLQPISKFRLHQSTKELSSLVRNDLLPQRMESDNRAHNH